MNYERGSCCYPCKLLTVTRPDVVEDVEKARFMARAENHYREKANKLWADAKIRRDAAKQAYLMVNEAESLGDSDQIILGG